MSTCIRAMACALAVFASVASYAAATPLGPSFVVSAPGYAGDPLSSPAVAMAPSGEFVVVWQRLVVGTTSSRIYGRRFSATGAPLGAQFEVSDKNTRHYNGEPAVAWNPAGGFIVVWEQASADQLFQLPEQLVARRYAADGTPKDLLPRTLNTPFLGHSPSVSVRNDGAFVVTWTDLSISLGEAGAILYGPKAQGFSPQALPYGPPFQLNTREGNEIGQATTAFTSDGGFVAVWDEYTIGPSPNYVIRAQGVYLRHFGIAGLNKDTAETRIDVLATATGEGAASPHVASNARGDVVAGWNGGSHFYARRFTGSGTPIDPAEFFVADLPSCCGGSRYAGGPLVGVFGRGAAIFGYGDGPVLARRFDTSAFPIDATEFRLDDAPAGQSAEFNTAGLATRPDGWFVATWRDSRTDASGQPTVRARLFRP